MASVAGRVMGRVTSRVMSRVVSRVVGRVVGDRFRHPIDGRFDHSSPDLTKFLNI